MMIEIVTAINVNTFSRNIYMQYKYKRMMSIIIIIAAHITYIRKG